jgi:hypothetical protein
MFGKHIPTETNPINAGIQHKFKFDNGYGASVIRGPYTYGGGDGLWELAVLRGPALCYDTPITSDVIGWQSEREIANLLDEIERLPVPSATASTDSATGDKVPAAVQRLVTEARGLIDEPGSNPEYERALVEIIIRCGPGMSHDADTDTVRGWLNLP